MNRALKWLAEVDEWAGREFNQIRATEIGELRESGNIGLRKPS